MRLSLKKKIASYIIVVVTLVSVLALILIDGALKQVEVNEYTRQSIDLSRTVAKVVDAGRMKRVRELVSAIYDASANKVSSDEWGSPEFDAYLAQYEAIEEDEDFLFLRDQLREIQDINHVDSLYLVYLDEDTKSIVYLVDAAYEDMCRPGTFDVLAGEDLAILEDPVLGFDPSITNTEEYGWNIATAKPVYSDSGAIVGYACVDISMNDIVNQRYKTLAIVTFLLLGLAALAIAGGIVLAERLLVRPINALSKASLQYYSQDEASNGSLFDELDIHTGDEIEVLADSMAKMEHEISGYADELKHMANSDPLTRVRNKRAFDVEMEHADATLGDAGDAIGLAMVDLNNLKIINDTYGHEKGDITIKLVCSLICRVFDHSPVFRVGGDEFVIVLKGHDLEHVDELLQQMSDAMEEAQGDTSLEPWEKISAAVGYAVYDAEKDVDMDALLNRADEAMYACKRRMKQEG